MKNKTLYYIIIINTIISILFIITITSVALPNKTSVIFLDVGQGDGILITNGQWQILIDGGSQSTVLLEKLGKYMPFWDRKVDVVIATHPDADHIGAQVELFKSYDVDTVITTEAFKDSQTSAEWRNAAERKSKKILQANESISIHINKNFDKAGVMKILFPRVATDVKKISDTNDTSIVTHLAIGETTFLMMGDLSTKQEANIKTSAVSVLKVGHHGSKTSTSEEFIKRVQPDEAIISAGEDNRYGHPNKEVIDRLLQNNINIIETSTKGDIIYICNTKKENDCKRQ